MYYDSAGDFSVYNLRESCNEQRNVECIISVNASSVQDIQQTLLFAAKHNVKLVVKNTGKNTTFHPTFLLVGAPPSGVISSVLTVSPGTTWDQVYTAAHANNVTILEGIGAGGTVGAGGGWILGTGHSILTPNYGLGIDNVVQFTVVLPNAIHVTANNFTNLDLFWALKGRGGPSFGILTSTTYRTHLNPPITAAFYTATYSRAAMISLVTSLNTNFMDNGWSGFRPYDLNSLNLTFIALGSPPKSPNALSVYNEFVNQSAALPGVNVTLSVIKPYTGIFDWYEDNFVNTADDIGFNYTLSDIAGVPLSSGSRLLPRKTFEKNTSALAQAYVDFAAARPFIIGGGVLPSMDPSTVSTNPTWRQMLVGITLAFSWPENATDADIIHGHSKSSSIS
ncbi:hypothetical protein M422DRAFT_46061 [Sphaerobolus stellatus SS14]|uniref:FAD-binding PCMH-type domain-containing protein n=1 Tax=Sphaerobolus stellatus (strain SS14) TaxID=990650 RepID=A0A0C9VH82_SPHS4|nr:hypothetical protein M422DRAFT_46061 [Sphaerobolus stellatus SS14]